MNWKITLFFACLAAAATFLLLSLPVNGSGFSQDPGDTCLGPEDPFCDPGGAPSTGGPSGSSFCYLCKWENSTMSCENNSSGTGDTCKITYYSNGNITCKVSGSSCSAYRIGS